MTNGFCGGCLQQKDLLPEFMSCEKCSENHRISKRNDPYIDKDQVHRLEREGQENPKDQLRVVISSMRGWVSNMEDGSSNPERLSWGLKQCINQLESLIIRYPDLAWDSPPFTSEKKQG